MPVRLRIISLYPLTDSGKGSYSTVKTPVFGDGYRLTRSGNALFKLKEIVTGAEVAFAFRLSQATAVISNMPAVSH